MLTTKQLAWAAGIFEGEGCCGYTSRQKNCQEVIVVQKDTWVLEKMQELFGGTICARKAGSIGTPSHRWKVSGPTARGFLMTIYSFLSPRRKEQVKTIGVFDVYDGVTVRRPGFQTKENHAKTQS
jgi:hypothetical protein